MRARIYQFLISGLLITLVGCAHTHPEVSQANYIRVHEEGYPIDQDRQGLTPKQFDEKYINKIIAGIDAWAEEAWNGHATKKARLLIYVHGGLNTYDEGLRSFEALLKEQNNPKAYPNLSSYYLLLINWNADLFSSLADDMFWIRFGNRNLVAGWLTSPFLSVGYLLNSLAGAPVAYWSQMGNAFDSWNENFNIPNETTADRVNVGITYFAAYPIRMLSVPFIKGYGTPAWEMMKRRNDLIFSGQLRPNAYDTKHGAGLTLMERLKQRIPAKNRWKTLGCREGELEITLVGHSMGTLVLTKLIQAHSDIHYERILYMGAASSIEEFEVSVLPYVTAHETSRFWSFSLATADEARERGSFDLYERGSLLIWIDNLFERVLTPMQLRIGKYRNYERYYKQRHNEFSIRDRLCFSLFRGLPREPRKHAEFHEPEKFERILDIQRPNACPSESTSTTR